MRHRGLYEAISGRRKKRKKYPSKSKMKWAFDEVFHNVPKNVVKTGKTGTAKRKMMVAIALSKARRA